MVLLSLTVIVFPLFLVVIDVADAVGAADVAVAAVVAAGVFSFYVVVVVAAVIVVVAAANSVSLRFFVAAAALAVGLCTAAPAAAAVIYCFLTYWCGSCRCFVLFSVPLPLSGYVLMLSLLFVLFSSLPSSSSLSALSLSSQPPLLYCGR